MVSYCSLQGLTSICPWRPSIDISSEISKFLLSNMATVLNHSTVITYQKGLFKIQVQSLFRSLLKSLNLLQESADYSLWAQSSLLLICLMAFYILKWLGKQFWIIFCSMWKLHGILISLSIMIICVNIVCGL